MKLYLQRKKLVWLLVCLPVISSCAAIAGRDSLPDLNRLSVGAERVAVEAELGAPISDLRSGPGQEGARRCIYKVAVRTKKLGDQTFANKVADTFVGFDTHQYLVVYDRDNRLLSAEEVESTALTQVARIR